MQLSGPMAGRTALITGAARRLGAAIARKLHGAGANVVIHYGRSRAEADALVAELCNARRNSAFAAQCDLLEVERLPDLARAPLDQFGQLDVLVNNASTFYATPVGAITTRQWDDLIGTNVRAPLLLSQACAPALRLSRGLIINIVDIHAARPLRAHTVYSTAKAGLAMLTRSLARELAPEIRVNGIAPGPVLWPEQGLDDAMKAEIIGKTALKRTGTPDDVSRTALFLATEAPFITGQIIAVDGGRSI